MRWINKPKFKDLFFKVYIYNFLSDLKFYIYNFLSDPYQKVKLLPLYLFIHCLLGTLYGLYNYLPILQIRKSRLREVKEAAIQLLL